jgi:hypothetical protein
MSDGVKIFLWMVDGLTPDDHYTSEEIKRFGFNNENDFSEKVICVIFRANVGDQAFPIRIWLRRSEVPEDQLIRAARKKAAEIISHVNEAVTPWIAL